MDLCALLSWHALAVDWIAFAQEWRRGYIENTYVQHAYTRTICS